MCSFAYPVSRSFKSHERSTWAFVPGRQNSVSGKGVASAFRKVIRKGERNSFLFTRQNSVPSKDVSRVRSKKRERRCAVYLVVRSLRILFYPKIIMMQASTDFERIETMLPWGRRETRTNESEVWSDFYQSRLPLIRSLLPQLPQKASLLLFWRRGIHQIDSIRWCRNLDLV